MTKGSLSKLVSRREQLKTQITKFATFIDDANNHAKITELKIRIQKIEMYFEEFSNVQSEIEILDDTDEQKNEGSQIENKFYEIVAQAKEIVEYRTNSASQPAPADGVLPTTSGINNKLFNVNLPNLSIPQFDGAYDKWSQFRDTFKALIHDNNSLTNIQKYYYLQTSLKGDAAKVIEALEVSDANYSVALSLLDDRFENKRITIKTHLKHIFELNNVIKDSFSSLRTFLDDFQKHFRALKTLQEPVEHWNSILIYLLVSKLDVNSKKEWETRTNKEVSPNIDKFIIFLNERCQLLESIYQVQSNKGIREIRAHAHVSTNNFACLYCKKNHSVYTCKEFLDLPVASRLSEIRKMHACTNCLRRGHSNTECWGRSCRKCGLKHNTLLHLVPSTNSNSEQNKQQSKNNKANSTPVDNQNSNALVTSNQNQNDNVKSNCCQNSMTVTHCRNNAFVILPTVLIYIYDKQNNPIKCRALLDGGSQSNFITYDLFKQLNLNASKTNMSIIGISSSVSNVSLTTRATIRSIQSNYMADINLLIINKITDNIPQFSFDKSNLVIPDDITLSDPSFNESQNVDLLLGAGIFYDLLMLGRIKLGNNQPIIQQTQLGWVITGPYDNSNKYSTHYCNYVQTSQCNVDNIDKQLESFWHIEECEPKLTIYSKEELECEQHFHENYQRDESGRFIVKLPFRNNYNQLGETYETAVQRFQSIERKFAKNASLKEKYCTFMDEYIRLGHMSLITPIDNSSSFSYYLPHHCVQKESSSTTKLRVVFDASAKSSSGLSLNDVLKVGPNIQDDIFSILLRFRRHNIAFTADIAKMYRCIRVHEDHQNYQRIVWRSDPTQPLRHFKLNTVTYGTSSASFLATRCLKQLALDNEISNPPVSQSIISDFYMDDWITGSDDLQSAIKLISQVTNILNDAGLHLRQWASNDKQILCDTNKNASVKLEYTIKNEEQSKTLGIFWHTVDDNFQYNATSEICNNFTKRNILSIVSQIFDPLGLLGPVIIKGKLILQKLWQLKIGWDDDIPEDLKISWSQISNNFRHLNDIKIPRGIIIKNYIQIEIHCFCDSSQMAYGTCLYIRSRDIQGNVWVKLACAKSRVAPIKSITLPRLELCGALLAAKLCHKVTQAFKLPINDTYYWCDSTIALAWIQSDASRLKTFVSNRVSQIQSLTKIEQWRHVPTESNSADVISRGLNPDQIANCSLWFDGPKWLQLEPEFWPRRTDQFSGDIPESKPMISLASLSITYDIISRFSSLNTLLHVVAYIIRFKSNALMKPEDRMLGNITIPEVEKATRIIVKLVQYQVFTTEVNLLKTNKPLTSKSKLLCLNPFLDQYGIIRVGGRLRNSSLDFDNKFPMVIPSKHHFTTLLIRSEHLKNLHAGPQAVLSNIRSRYWPLSGRRTVRSVLRKCIVCFRVNPPLMTQKMGQLPTARVTNSLRPFHSCGVDFAGPYLIKETKCRNKRLIKTYTCIFICFATKAVHLELVNDLSTEAFLNALKRFVSRRGLCANIHSDNATNFVGANKCLGEFVNLVKSSELQNYLLQNQIRWHFIPPRTPHMGGLWESAVRLMKFHLKRVVGDAHFTFDELYTMLTQVESILNSRPLYPLTDDPNDLEVLTPGHFLIGAPMTSIPEVPVDDNRSTHVNRYKYLRFCVQQFWIRWSKEYLHHLQQRSKWNTEEKRRISEGVLCVVREDNAPPHRWKIGRIIQTHPGRDGIVRVVTVKMRHGTFKRGVSELAVLPIETDG